MNDLYHEVYMVPTYAELKPGSKRVTVVMCNLSCKMVMFRRGETVESVTTANAVPKLLAPKAFFYDLEPAGLLVQEGDLPRMEENIFRKACSGAASREGSWEGSYDEGSHSRDSQSEVVDEERIRMLFSKWISLAQCHGKKRIKRILEFHHLFALDDQELGKTDLAKHTIKLQDYTPFKEQYRHIPPHQYEEVCIHLQEMLDVGTIRRSCSPWASAVLLVRKKDGSLRFYINLRKLNAKMIKDAYSLPRIKESLDCLNEARIFTSLDLKSG